MKIYKSFSSDPDKPDMTLVIEVNYNPSDCSIEILEIFSRKCKFRNGVVQPPSYHDITEQVLQAFPSLVEEIKKMNWEEVYTEALAWQEQLG